MVEVWVCNSSPLISLARIDRLDLVESLGPRVVVPATVMREIEAGSERDSAIRALRGSARLAPIPDTDIPAAIMALRLDPGESQVLASALARPGSGVVIDDRAARRGAALLSLPLIGTIGIIALARQRGFIEAAAPVYRSLRAAGLFLSPALIRAVLEGLGEDW